MTLADLAPRRRLAAALGVLLTALCVALVALLGGAAPAPADHPPAQNDCRGHLEKGEPADDGGAQIRYVFGCDAPITGYQLTPRKPADAYETEIFGLDPTTKQVNPTSAFGCYGDFPAYAINCTGQSAGHYEIISGTFGIEASDVCAEPREDVLLSVVTSGIDAKGKPTTAIAGPFDLGRPQGCKATKYSGRLRIPKD